jgi:sigma-E factor negative regulatory protein RseA
MSNPSQPQQPRAELLSALADGELDVSGTLAACELWRSDERAQMQWADYHLIGDVLRSEDLARSGAHESSLFARIQAELAQQAVVLAPLSPGESVVATRHSAARHSRRAWWAASAAAGFVAVAGAWSVLHAPLPVDAGALVAQSEPAPLSASAPETHVAAGTVVRDAELDRYLAAHKQFSSTSVIGATSGSLRQVVLESSGR